MITVEIGSNQKPGKYPQPQNYRFLVLRDGEQIAVIENRKIRYIDGVSWLDAYEQIALKEQIEHLMQMKRSEYFGV